MDIWQRGGLYFSNFGSLKSTETTVWMFAQRPTDADFSNFGSLKSTETTNERTGDATAKNISAISAR